MMWIHIPHVLEKHGGRVHRPRVTKARFQRKISLLALRISTSNGTASNAFGSASTEALRAACAARGVGCASGLL